MKAKAVSQSYRENRIMGSIYFPFHALSLSRTQWKRNVGQYNQKYNTIRELNQSPNKKYNYELLSSGAPQRTPSDSWHRELTQRIDILSNRMTWLFSND